MAKDNRVIVDWDTARDILDVIHAERGGLNFPQQLLNRLTLRIARQMPEEELPEYVGGTWEPCEDE